MYTHELRQTLFVEVLLPLKVKSTFTYRVPFELNDEVVIGKRVSIPFGRKKVMAGLIYAISEHPPKKYEAKYIFDILDSEPLVSDDQITFWQWIAYYYMTPLGLVYNAAMPAGLKLEGEAQMVLNPNFDYTNEQIDQKEILILENIRSSKELSISQAAALLKTQAIHKIVKSLYMKGAIFLKEDLKDTYTPKEVLYIHVAKDIQADKSLSDLFDQLEKRAKKQLEALMTFIANYSISGECAKSELVKHGVTNAAINALIDKGVFIQEKKIESRVKFSEGEAAPEVLNTEQTEALSLIKGSFAEGKPALLYGVTSSGKTHVYTHLITEFLDQGKQVLYLLPEIALTSQLIGRLQTYFGERLVVTHSKFSNNERVEVYEMIRSGKPLLVLGTRSAIFSPFVDLGLIVIDEEHESSFKQQEPAPRFHARDTAMYLAAKTGSHVVLGSATPQVESFYNAHHNKYTLVPLNQRYKGVSLPTMHVVDMQEQKKQKRIKGVFSDTLLEAISEAKERGKQTILFQNKKGYVPMLECNVCAWTPKCENCDISLTFYKYQDNLRCHYCGYTHEIIKECATCGNKGIELVGYGTERIEDELNLYLPDLRVKRMDYNTTRAKNSHTKLIDAFARGDIDVLIGTQMVAKGLDFENVTIVGILNADHLINFPDFRSNERAYSLITQVAGRAGRRDEKGNVYIQTSKPDHFILDRIVDHDYQGMYELDLVERKNYDYPPFYRLIKIQIKHKDALVLYKLGGIAKTSFINYFGSSMLGPEKPYVSKIRNWYILNFMLKIENNGPRLKEQKRKLSGVVNQLEQLKEFAQARVIVDVDPI